MLEKDLNLNYKEPRGLFVSMEKVGRQRVFSASGVLSLQGLITHSSVTFM